MKIKLMSSIILSFLITVAQAMDKTDTSLASEQDTFALAVTTTDFQQIVIPPLLFLQSTMLKTLVEEMKKGTKNIAVNVSKRVLENVISVAGKSSSDSRRFILSLELSETALLLNALQYLRCAALLESTVCIFARELIDVMKRQDFSTVQATLQGLNSIINSEVRKCVILSFICDYGKLEDVLRSKKSGMRIRDDEARAVFTRGSVLVTQKLILQELAGSSPKTYTAYDFNDESLRERFTFRACGSPCLSSDGQSLAYVPHEHSHGDVKIVDLKSLKEHTIATECGDTECSLAADLSFEGQELCISGTKKCRVYDIKTGLLERECAVPSQHIWGDKLKQLFLHIKELPQNFFFIGANSEQAILGDVENVSSVTKLFPDGSKKQIPLPEEAEGTSCRYHRVIADNLLLRVFRVNHGVRSIDVIDLGDDMPRTVFKGDKMTSENGAECPQYKVSGDKLCVIGTQDIFIVDLKENKTQRCRKPSKRSKAESISFNNRCNKILILYADGTAWLYIDEPGSPLKGVQISKRSFCVEFLNADAMLLRGEYLSICNLHIDELLGCSLAQIFFIRRYIKSPEDIEAESFDRLFKALPQEIQNTLLVVSNKLFAAQVKEGLDGLLGQ
jgi:hypothetical protein